MLVTLVMPVYNQERYLSHALEMALGQTYPELEVLAVDDGSTDSSPEILREFSERDSRLHVVTQENRGLLGANVTGIRSAQGEYVCFFDPDDEIGKDFVGTFVEALDRPYDFVAQGIIVSEGGITSSFLLAGDKALATEELRDLSESYVLSNSLGMDHTIFVSRCNKLYRKSCLLSFLDDYAGCVGVSLGEDSIFTYLLLNHASSGRIESEPCSYVYVKRDDSMTHAVDADAYIAKCDATFEAFSTVISKYRGDMTPAWLLYYSQMQSLLSLASNVQDHGESLGSVYASLQHSSRYRESLSRALAYGDRLCPRSLRAWLIYHRFPVSFISRLQRVHKAVNSAH